MGEQRDPSFDDGNAALAGLLSLLLALLALVAYPLGRIPGVGPQWAGPAAGWVFPIALGASAIIALLAMRRRAGRFWASLGLLFSASMTAILLVSAGMVVMSPGRIVSTIVSAPTGARLFANFGVRLGGVHVGQVSYEEGPPFKAVTFELRGDVSDADLCRAMVAVRGAVPSADSTLQVRVLCLERDHAAETLQWHEGRRLLVRDVGNGCDCEITGAPHACAFTSRTTGYLTGVGRAALLKYALGAAVPWQKPD